MWHSTVHHNTARHGTDRPNINSFDNNNNFMRTYATATDNKTNSKICFFFFLHSNFVQSNLIIWYEVKSSMFLIIIFFVSFLNDFDFVNFGLLWCDLNMIISRFSMPCAMCGESRWRCDRRQWPMINSMIGKCLNYLFCAIFGVCVCVNTIII